MKQNMEIITMDVKAFDALAGHVEAIERKAEALCRRQEDVSLKKWLDNQDVCWYMLSLSNSREHYVLETFPDK